jgi:hypothetical protein
MKKSAGLVQSAARRSSSLLKPHFHKTNKPFKNMNTKITSFCATLLLAAATCLQAGEPPKPAPSSPQLEKLKSLAGTWQGKTDIGQGPIDMTVQYRVLAAGSVVEERAFPGTPNEMVTMFYDKEGKLALTHYCMLGNRPEMALKASDANSLTFDFDSCCGIDPKKETHMHAMTLRFDDANTITTSCKALSEGKEMPTHDVTLKRVKTETASIK